MWSMCRARYCQRFNEGQLQEWLVWCASARQQRLIDCQDFIITITARLWSWSTAGYIKLSESPPTTSSLLARGTKTDVKWDCDTAKPILKEEMRRYARGPAWKDNNQSFCGCIPSTCYLFSTSQPDQTQQALQNKHPSILWDSQPFWVTARMKTTLTLNGSAEENTQHELYNG